MDITHKGIKYKFFWDGIFSNWHESYFNFDGIMFNCGEQYMMYYKAITFNDKEIAKKILEEKIPSYQKRLGRKIRNFNEEKWNLVKYKIVKDGLREKFIQDPRLKNYLLKYKGYQMVEASPDDRIWGIGYEEDEAISNINDWGENLLGKILTELSLEIK